jgi:hypothetical protein
MEPNEACSLYFERATFQDAQLPISSCDYILQSLLLCLGSFTDVLPKGCLLEWLFHYIPVIYKIPVHFPTPFVPLRKHKSITHQDISSSFTLNEIGAILVDNILKIDKEYMDTAKNL